MGDEGSSHLLPLRLRKTIERKGNKAHVAIRAHLVALFQRYGIPFNFRDPSQTGLLLSADASNHLPTYSPDAWKKLALELAAEHEPDLSRQRSGRPGRNWDNLVSAPIRPLAQIMVQDQTLSVLVAIQRWQSKGPNYPFGGNNADTIRKQSQALRRKLVAIAKSEGFDGDTFPNALYFLDQRRLAEWRNKLAKAAAEFQTLADRHLDTLTENAPLDDNRSITDMNAFAHLVGAWQRLRNFRSVVVTMESNVAGYTVAPDSAEPAAEE